MSRQNLESNQESFEKISSLFGSSLFGSFFSTLFFFFSFFWPNAKAMWVKNDKNEMVGQTTQNEKKKEKKRRRGTHKIMYYFSHTPVSMCVHLFIIIIIL